VLFRSRARLWVQNDQQSLWEGQIRKRYRKLEEARAELFSARLSQFHESTSLCLMDVQRAERANREAEAKMTVIKKWDRELEDRTDPLVKQVTQFHTFLATDMKRAVAYLDQVVKTLEAYADVSPAGVAKTSTRTKNKPAGEEEHHP
jgi:hypothetical protein